MVRRSTPQSKIDDDAFPVRVRIHIPDGGFGQSMDAIQAWLDKNLTATGYAWHGGGRQGLLSITAFYFRSAQSAAQFMDAFPALELADGTTCITYTSPAKTAAEFARKWREGDDAG